MNLSQRQPQRISKAQLLAEFFQAHPMIWVDGRDLEFAGRYAWRTRLSELRRAPFNMTIANHQLKSKRPDGSSFVISAYRFEPPDEAAEGLDGTGAAADAEDAGCHV